VHIGLLQRRFMYMSVQSHRWWCKLPGPALPMYGLVKNGTKMELATDIQAAIGQFHLTRVTPIARDTGTTTAMATIGSVEVGEERKNNLK